MYHFRSHESIYVLYMDVYSTYGQFCALTGQKKSIERIEESHDIVMKKTRKKRQWMPPPPLEETPPQWKGLIGPSQI